MASLNDHIVLTTRLLAAFLTALTLGSLVACESGRESSSQSAAGPLSTASVEKSFPSASSVPSTLDPPTSTPAPSPELPPTDTARPQSSGLVVNTPVPTSPAEAADPTPFPAEASATKNSSTEPLWRHEAELAGLGNPVVVDGVVYVGTMNVMNALDARTGALLWSYTTEGILWGSPLVDDRAVYFGPFNRHVYAVDARAGTLLWRYAAEHDVSAMAMADGMIYASTEDGPLIALEAQSGEMAWSHQPEGEVGWPGVGDGVVYLGTERHLLILDARTGRVLSRLETDHFFWHLVLVDGVLYGATVTQNPVGLGHALHALDPATGEGIWSYETDDGVTVAPVVEDGVAYVASLDGRLYALHAGTGELRWSHRVEDEDAVWGRPTLADGMVYFGSAGCCVYALDAATGQLLWRYETGGLVSTPAVSADGTVYVGSMDGSVYALPGPGAGPFPTPTPDPTPEPKLTPEPLPAAPAARVAWMRQVGNADIVLYEEEDGVVYARSVDGYARAFSAEDGRELWRYYMGEERDHHIMGLIRDGVAYVRSRDGTVRALDAANGRLLWTYDGGEDYFVSVSAADGKTYVGFAEGLLALDTRTGEKLWRLDAVGVPLPHVAVHDGVAYPYSSIIRYSHIYAVAAGTGELLWEFRAPEAIETPPAFVNGTVYVGSAGKVYALDAATGELRWIYDTALLRGPSEGDWPRIFAAPIVVDDIVYVGTNEGWIGETFEERHSVLYALDAASGDLIWHRRTDGAGRYLQEQDGNLFLTNQHGITPVGGIGSQPKGLDPQPEWESRLLNGYLHVLDASTGNVIWTGRTNGNPTFSMGIQKGVLYVHSIDEYAYTNYLNANAPDINQYVTAFSVATGQPLWFYRARKLSSALTGTDHGLVFVALPGGWVYALTKP